MNTTQKQTKNQKRRENLRQHELGKFVLDRFDAKILAKSACKADESRVLAILEFAIEKGYQSFCAGLVDDFLGHIINERKLSSKSVNNYNTVIRFLSQEALRYKLTSSNVSAGIKNFRYRPKSKRLALSLKECNKVLQAAKKLCRASAIGFELHYRLGLRISELIALSWSDVSLKDKTLIVRRANVVGEFKLVKSYSSERVIALNDDECALLLSLYAITGNRDSIKVAVTQEDNRSIEIESIKPIICHLGRDSHYPSVKHYQQWFCEQAFRLASVQFKGRGTNIGRHTFASHTRSFGIPDCQIAEQMGHSGSSTNLFDLFYASTVNDKRDIKTERAKCFSDLVQNTPDPISFDYKQYADSASTAFSYSYSFSINGGSNR
ncbi:TPA: tyrosine-type recombinase/integrase [Vibrio vulnificus]|uniref:tyrosine-type recombinase/integrase n=1 Tax=Vibrio harveyi group TaxID=717610 RepID=UPI00111DF2E5|nr:MULTISPECIES: tyrosine-type recombinase/integrase [Vibrio harveyi group]EKA5638177.1 tyrosine-type recombinase/integrase [Vibrio navarrensis]MBS9846468.1 tyrosine-type recombinase/integrase [Vibrio alginolyticus]TOM22913.1 hypothetical protein CGH81_22980 [Vibrio parahaemolyticus]